MMSVTSAEQEYFYDEYRISEMLEVLGYMTFQESFLLKCKADYPELSLKIEETTALLQPYLKKIDKYFLNERAPIELREQYRKADYKKYTYEQVENDFTNGKYKLENCKFAVWSIKEEGIDPVIMSYL